MKNKFLNAITLAVIMAMLITSLALADQVVNNLDLSVDADFETMSLNVGGLDGTTTLRIVEQNGDGKNGCNLTGAGSQLTVSVASSNTSVATVSPATVTFNACGDTRVLTVTPVSQGSANITLSFTSVTTSSGGVSSSSFDLLPGRFTVNVAPPPNTAPVVTLTGVTHGASYEYGSVPAAGCSVQDVEDGDSTFAASLSSISGSLSAYGLGTQTATCSYTDSGGLNATVEATYEIVDTTAPVITFVSRTPANGNGWNNTDVIVNWSCTDNVGVVSASVSQTLSGEGSNQSATGTCTDLVGLTASNTQTGINIDKTPPTITFVSPPTSAWYNADVTANWSCTDALSGVVSASVSSATSGEGSAQSVTGTCTDNAGNTASDTRSYKVDKTAPTISAAATTSPNGAGWYNANVTVHFTCVDGLSGIPDGACPADQVLSAEGMGVSSMAQTVTDAAGNTSDPSNVVTVNIDKTAPAISGAPDRAPNGNGWYNADVTVSFTCADALSGVASCSGPSTLGEGASQSVTGNASDLAGNSASTTVSGINIDKTAPSITITTPPSGASYLLNQLVAANYGCTDTLSGIVTCVGPVSNGSNIDTATTGSKSFTVNASDAAGNTSSATNAYSVAFKLCVLYDQTKAHKSGSTVPLKLQLCDFNGVNYSSAAIVVKAISVSKIDNSSSGILDDSGAANSPDMNFRYDATLGGTGGYIFNLSTKGLTTGTWKVTFTVNGAGTYFVQFDVK